MKLYQVCNDDQFKTWNKRREYIDYKGKHYVVSRVVDYERTNVFSTRKMAKSMFPRRKMILRPSSTAMYCGLICTPLPEKKKELRRPF